MKKPTKVTTAPRHVTARARQTGLRKLNDASKLEFVRAEVEQLEQQRVEHETRARLARNNLYNAGANANPAGWTDPTKG